MPLNCCLISSISLETTALHVLVSEEMTSGAAECYIKNMLCRILIMNLRAELPSIMSFGKLLAMCAAPLEILL